MAVTPVVGARAEMDLELRAVGCNATPLNAARVCIRFDWKALMNGGYVIRARLLDANYNILKTYLIEQNYLSQARATIFQARFRLRWPGVDNQTAWQVAYIT